MDKETEQHLKEYKAQLGHLKERIKSTENLISDILQAEEEVHTSEHDFPNYAKYNKGTDI